MTHARRMMETNPSGTAVDASALVECIEACFDCAQSCTACADACLGEDEPKALARCIRLNLDCAATGRILSRQMEFEATLAGVTLRACVEACRLCGEKCEQHAREMGMEHCRICAEACRRCEAACSKLLSTMGL